MGYIEEKLAGTVDEFAFDTVAGEPTPPEDAFLAAIDDETKNALETLFALCGEGTFPKFWDFYPAFGADLGFCENLDEGVYALANDGAGNYFVLYPEGHVDIWCHDEGGYMEGNEFDTLDSVIHCMVLTTAVKSEKLDWDDVMDTFEERADREAGWEFFYENVEEYVEDL